MGALGVTKLLSSIEVFQLSNAPQWSSAERARDDEEEEDDIMEVELIAVDDLDRK